MVETVFVHESGEMLECGCLFFPAQKNDPQGFMSALTYGRRASLMAACGIAPEDDDGNAASKAFTSIMNANVLADCLSNIDSCESLETLQKAFKQAIDAAGNDANAKTKIIAAKDAKKAELK